MCLDAPPCGSTEANDDEGSLACLAELMKLGGNFGHCLLDAESRFAHSKDAISFDSKTSSCHLKFNRSFARTLQKYPDANCTGVSKADLSFEVVSHFKRYADLAKDESNNVSSADGAAIEQKVTLIRHAEKFKYPKTETEKEAPNSTLYNLSQCGHERAD